MEIRDKNIRQSVDVSEADCFKKKCYWPRQNPGSFCQGRGYRSYGDERDNQYLCGTRQAHGCPDKPQYHQKYLGLGLEPPFTSRQVGNGKKRHIFFEKDLKEGFSLCGLRPPGSRYEDIETCRKCMDVYKEIKRQNQKHL